MMMRVFCLLLLSFSFSHSDPSVEELQEQLKDFLITTQSYKYPTSYRDFINGSYDLTKCEEDGIYDFIVVGAGSTGCALANRLSEISDWKILLLEAGGEENNITDIPAIFNQLQLSSYNWGFKSVPQKNSLLSFVDHIEPIPRGRGVGGSSLINAMMYVRGNKKDFDKWGRLNPGWSYRSVLPYFIKSENTTVYPQDYAYHGHNGELHTETRNFQSPVTTAFLSAVQESGYHIQDYNGKNQIVFSPTQFTTENGRRCSGDKAFIRPIRTRNNLKILTNSYVVKIDMKDKKARGVKYVNDGKQYCARAEKEVILSAGVIKSPHLLMLSGIGPKEHLKSLGIEVIKDLPVGKNLWDHLVSSLLTFTINYTFPEFDQRTLLEDYLKGHGLFTLPMAIEALGFTNINGRDVSVPDLEYIFLATKAPNDSLQQFQKLTNYNEDVYNKVVKKLAGQAFWRMYSLLLYPKSRGTVTLRSNDPYDYLNIDPNYFSDPDSYDLNTLAASVEHTLKLAESKPMQSFNSQPLKIDLLNCPSSGFGTKEYNKCFMKNTARTLHHFSGTCKMGPFWDKTAVVGHDSKVHGIKGLRVADTSIIPCPTGGHTNAIAYMIGEKISDEIKRYWGAL